MLETVLLSGRVRGVMLVDNSRAEDFVIAGQFASFFLLPGLRETTLGEFLRLHPTLLNTAFGSRRFIYEPMMEWKDGISAGDSSIDPDILLARDDGYFDIFDLMTAALERKAITKGPRRRRRSIDYVEEGVAQLVHYEEYFCTAENAAHALAKYGVEVRQPHLTLVVGNYDNADLAQVVEAGKHFNAIRIIDYDSLIRLFLSQHAGLVTSPG